VSGNLPDVYAATTDKIRWVLLTYLPDELARINALRGYTGPRALVAPYNVSVALDFTTIDPQQRHWDQVPHVTLVPIIGRIVRRQPAVDAVQEWALTVAWASDPATLDESLHRAHVYAAACVAVLERRLPDVPYTGSVWRCYGTSGLVGDAARQIVLDTWTVQVRHRFEVSARVCRDYSPTRAPDLPQPGAYGSDQSSVGPVSWGGVVLQPGILGTVPTTTGPVVVSTGRAVGSPVILLRQWATDPPVVLSADAAGEVTVPGPIAAGEYTLTAVDAETGAVAAYRLTAETAPLALLTDDGFALLTDTDDAVTT
jgi:hypothetical protein